MIGYPACDTTTYFYSILMPLAFDCTLGNEIFVAVRINDADSVEDVLYPIILFIHLNGP